MTFWDWLASPEGLVAQHALIGLVLAITGYVTYATKRKAEANAKLLDSHLERHIMDDLEDNPREN